MKPKKNITLKDLAKELGVSAATVSRALKGYPDIGEKTTQAVRALAKEWNYRPNSMAVGLRQQRSKIIGVLVPELVHHFFSSIISGIMDEAEKHGYCPMLFQSGESSEREQRDTNTLLNTRVDGILVSLANDSIDLPHLEEAQRMGMPVVMFDKIKQQFPCSKVTVNDFQGAKAAIEHLLQQGHTQIGYIKGPPLPENSRERFRGYSEALQQYGIPLDHAMIRECSAVSQDEGYCFTKELLAAPTPPTAIFCATDLVAMGAITAIKEANLCIPNDVALVGFSNWQISQVVDPPLTSIHQPGYEMGQVATRLLLQEIEHKEDGNFEHQQIVLPAALVVRGSSIYTRPK